MLRLPYEIWNEIGLRAGISSGKILRYAEFINMGYTRAQYNIISKVYEWGGQNKK